MKTFIPAKPNPDRRGNWGMIPSKSPRDARAPMAWLPLAQVAFLALTCSTLSGCLSNMAAHEDSASLKVRWADNFEAARHAACQSHRPVLVVMAAGDLRDKC